VEPATAALARPARSTRAHAALPNLIVIGAMKAGTTSLHHYLSVHPEVGMSEEKELDFFTERWDRGPDWYARQFDAAKPVRGESSTSYTKFPRYAGVPERIRGVVPEARLVYVVRDPVARMVSHYVHEVAGGREQRPAADALAPASPEQSDYVAFSSYALQLERYLACFDESQVLVLSSEALRRRRRETLARVFAFAGVEPAFWCEAYERELGRADQRVRHTPAARALLRISRTVPRRVRTLLPEHARPVRAYAARTAIPVARPELPADLRAELAAHLRPDAERLRALTGQRFEEWCV
jgi:hypothetical protein